MIEVRNEWRHQSYYVPRHDRLNPVSHSAVVGGSLARYLPAGSAGNQSAGEEIAYQNIQT
jgi:hypothetical protein